MSEMHRWKVRDGNQGDMERIISLREIVFGEEEQDKQNPRFWRWEFTEGPDGKGLIYIVEDGNMMIGHFADIPRKFSAQGENVLGTLSIDLMVHPDYRRKGIFEAMGRYGIERVKKEKGILLTAYPIRSETIHGFKKIGWRVITRLPVLVYPIRFNGIFNRYVNFAPLSSLAGGVARCLYLLLYGLKRKEKIGEVGIEEVHQLDDQFDHFWKKVSTFFPILGVRNREYLTWRYLNHPTRGYTIYRTRKNGEMQGYIVLRKVDLLNFNSAVIVDLLALDEESLMTLVARGILSSREQGADVLGFMVPQNHSYHRIMRGMGFLPSPKTFLLMIYPHTDREVFLSPGKWYVTWGDTDVI